MKRRKFIRQAALAGLVPSTFGCLSGMAPASAQKKKQLSAYYLRAHMYTIVPRQVREDMEWMAAIGTDNVCISLLEQDIWAAVENVNIIIEEAERVGMKVYGVPTRLAGVYAGAPKVPSLWLSSKPHLWAKRDNGKYQISNVNGPRGGMLYPEVEQFIGDTVLKMAEVWPKIPAYVWDEPKYASPDYSDHSREILGANFSRAEWLAAATEVQSRINERFLAEHPDKQLHLFTYAFVDDVSVDLFTSVRGLTSVGCDGRPWHHDDVGKTDGGEGKTLLGNGERFVHQAREKGKEALWLIENHNLRMEDLELMDRQLPQVIEKGVGHLIYYYYPRNVADPDRAMAVIKRHVAGYGQ
jgi:hypothetical protein